jgi:glyoxylase-like metal-dependent hydrolase (beta-lactamase superfamily II)
MASRPRHVRAGPRPDGNSVFLDSPEGLILVDTGRHPAHQEKLLAYAKARRRPIAAIVNTHWHLDHSGGNAEIRAAFPAAPVYASTALEGALTGFFPRSRKAAEEFLASRKASPELEAEIRRDFAAMDDAGSLRATRAVIRSGEVRIAGRRLRLNLAPFAATEGDVWIYDPSSKLLIAGDLVVGPVPFFDTGCPEGWRKALDSLAATPFATLIPGHGEPMSRPQFLRWRGAFNGLLDCAASDRAKAECVAGWTRDAAEFIPAGDRGIEGMVGYYLDTRLRAPQAEREKYCRPLR